MPRSQPEWQNLVRLVGGNEAILEGGLTEIRQQPSNPNQLSEFDRLLIWIYSSTDDLWYEHINSQLWYRPSIDVVIFANCLDRALSKLNKHSGEVYRGYHTDDFAAFMIKYYASQPIVWPGFTSTSLNPRKAFAGNILFRISSHNARILGFYADKPSEEEALFATQARFRVRNVERDTASAVIWLDEIA